MLNFKISFSAIFIFGIFCVFLCLGIGRYTFDIASVLSSIFNVINGDEIDKKLEIVIFNIRLPRVTLALLVGASLAISGAAFQSLFSNPLATPDILGVSSGASFGAVLAILLSLNAFLLQIVAMLFGLIALAITYRISSFKNRNSIIMIILGGIVVGAIFSALVSLVKYTADSEEVLPVITFWLLGSLSSAKFDSILVSLPFMFIGIFIIFLYRWRLNIITLNEDEAKSLGINLKQIRLIIMISATAVTASSVAMCGQVGWIGLLVPHICRMLFGSNNIYVIPSSILIGAIFMLLIDTLARSISNAEIPISILTALIGAPLFIFLLRKSKGFGL